MTSSILFLCNTYMQLIAAIQIRRKLFADAAVDLLLSNHSVNSEKVASRLEEIHVFDSVKIIDSKEFIYQQNKVQDVLDVIRLSLNVGEKYRNILTNKICSYDRIFYFNYDLLLYTIMDECNKRGKKPILCRFEEGIHTYQNMLMHESETNGKRIKMINGMRTILRKQCISETTVEYYVFFDSLFPSCDKEVHKIPRIDRNDHELVQILNQCFDYYPEEDTYKEKYIFFGSSRAIDGYETNETQIVLKIADMVGKENLSIKMHPRDTRNVYEEYGIKVNRSSSVPWEVIQMNHDFSEHIFFTMSSGSVISGCALLGDKIKTYLLYPMDKEKDKKFYNFCEISLKRLILKLQEGGLCNRHQIINTMGEYLLQNGKNSCE